jgi:hypothetical protein
MAEGLLGNAKGFKKMGDYMKSFLKSDEKDKNDPKNKK